MSDIAKRRALEKQARRYLKRNDGPLPLTIAFALIGVGLDPSAIEDEFGR